VNCCILSYGLKKTNCFNKGSEATQQKEVGGSMSRKEACKHHLELMKEGEYTKKDWNIRRISFCEH
jgi:hypothetical protein